MKQMLFRQVAGVGWWLLIGCVMAIFSVAAWTRLDPDFGWHYMTGNYILEHKQVPKMDPFSYTMPTYHYVDHAWLSDVVWAVVYPRFGMLGLSILYAAIVVATILIATYPFYNLRSALAVFLAVPMFLLRFAVRTQVIDWLLFAVFLRLLSLKTYKKQILLILFLWIWANLHGGFVVGLAVWGMSIAVDCWQKKRVLFADVACWLVGIGVTFLNPYGIELWREVVMTLWGNDMRTYIVEWKPGIFNFEPAFVFALVLSVYGIWMQRAKFPAWMVILVGGLVLESFLSTRHVALFAVLFLFVWPKLLSNFEKMFSSVVIQRSRSRMFYWILTLVALLLFVWVSGWLLVGQLRNSDRYHSYPVSAVVYLQKNPFEGNLFSEYGWGGYLVWQYPEKKTFIDGRMAIWRRSEAPEGETTSAFKDTIDITENGNFHPYFDTYNVTAVLWPKSKSNASDLLSLKIPKLISQIFNIKEPVDLLKKLDEAGWKKVYEDQIAVIYMKDK